MRKVRAREQCALHGLYCVDPLVPRKGCTLLRLHTIHREGTNRAALAGTPQHSISSELNVSAEPGHAFDHGVRRTCSASAIERGEGAGQNEHDFQAHRQIQEVAGWLILDGDCSIFFPRIPGPGSSCMSVASNSPSLCEVEGCRWCLMF